MSIESITINDRQQVVVRTEGSDRLLPDGTYRNEAGAAIEVLGGRIAQLTVDAPAALASVVEEVIGNLVESAAHIDLTVAKIEESLVSFNVHYLQLQQAMQQESRQFTMVSNIMKAKHDTARSAINNIR